MANEVDILIKATDKASRDIDKVNRTLGETTKTSGGLKKAWGDLKTAVPGLTGAISAMVNPLTIASAGIGMMAKFVRDSIGETVEYNKQIRELTQTLGLSADETSRVVQVADDWGISIEEVRAALGIMNKNGLTPSIENLAALADEYVNTTDKSEFAEHAAKLLGRQYETLIPLFAEGGDSLREQAAAIDDSLIATEASIQAARDYELAMDGMGDAVDGLKYRIGNELIPVLTQATETIMLLVNWESAVNDMLEEQDTRISQTTGTYHDYLVERTAGLVIAGRMEQSEADVILRVSQDEDAVRAATAAYGQLSRERIVELVIAGDLTEAEGDLLYAQLLEYGALGDLTSGYEMLTEAQYTAVQSGVRYNEEHDVRIAREQRLREETILTTDAIEGETEATENYSQAMNDLRTSIAGAVGNELDDYLQAQHDVSTAMGEVRDRIDE